MIRMLFAAFVLASAAAVLVTAQAPASITFAPAACSTGAAGRSRTS